MNPGKNSDVWLVDQSEVASRVLALIDGIDAMSKTVHLTIENVLGDRLTRGLPCLGQGFPEWLHLGNKRGVRDRYGTTSTNLFQRLRIKFLIIMISGTIMEVIEKWVPGPLITACTPCGLPRTDCILDSFPVRA